MNPALLSEMVIKCQTSKSGGVLYRGKDKVTVPFFGFVVVRTNWIWWKQSYQISVGFVDSNVNFIVDSITKEMPTEPEHPKKYYHYRLHVPSVGYLEVTNGMDALLKVLAQGNKL